ncbi:HAD-IC family P-type ATPase [Candidatus Saccharibacteria bacterium]|nr:HAD-IC family P-type ATPase [Candidatus Saccharibacteria bacterium]
MARSKKTHKHYKSQNSTWRIIAKNTFTLFNIVNIILAVMVFLVGSYKNMLFILIAIENTLISIINELRAKRIVDKLKLLSEQKPTIIKDGKAIQVDPASVKPGDVTVLSLGDQILYDSILTSGVIEVNESFITGEQESIEKHPGDKLISGSFIVAGTAEAKVETTGEDNFVTKLQTEASYIKTADSKLFSLMNKIVKYISYSLIPIGALLLWARFRTEADTTTAVTSTVAALINMIPEGLILLTSSILALATIRLSRKKILVQDLYAIETLARVDTICLDKTGTLTTGKMTVHDYTALEKSFESALKAILSHQTSENATVTTLRQKFLKTAKDDATEQIGKITDVISFSSERKCSGVKTKNAEYLLGAIEFITDDKSLIKQVKSASGGYRTLAVVKREDKSRSRSIFGDGPNTERLSPATAGAMERSENDFCPHATLLGYIRLEDEIRPTAHKIVNYFYDNDIAVKIISGDDVAAVTEIAEKVGVKDLRAIDLSSLNHKNYTKLVQDYAIFTRVTPSEKKELIKALKKQGSTVAMTGDGVNDILAMKEADVSLAIGEGSDAARRASKFVLLDSGFEAVPSIIDEGRQSINNLERSTSLFLAKTVYASLLAVLFTFLPLNYPYIPIQMTLLNFVCIGAPGVILALEHNTERIKNKFVSNIKHYSVPTGIIIAIAMIILSTIATVNHFDKPLLTTLSAIITFAIYTVLIYQISKPLNLFRAAILAFVIIVMVGALLLPLTRAIFEFI